MKELKRIDFEAGTFTANGVNYTIEGTLSIERYAELQIIEKELAYGFTVKSLFDKLKVCWDLLNKMKFAEMAINLNDMMRGVAKVQERQPIILKICALFMNAPDEDRRTITVDMINKKISDWKAEGIAMQDFFQAASSSVNGFSEIYETVTRIISAQEKTEQAESQ
jgi:hypothetical protein